MRKLAILIICLMLTGCQALTFSVDGLLSAPNVADEQSAIYQALIESAGRGITLEYPRNGDYRSAFIAYDIDADGEEETLAFYSVSSVTDSNVKIAVLDRSDGEWRSMYELAGAGSSVDRVLFLGNDMAVGYSAQDYEENSIRLYSYTDGVFEAIYDNTYTVLEKADLDGEGREEIVTVKRSGAGIEINALQAAGEVLYKVYGLAFDTGSGIGGYGFGKLGDKTALYLDIASDESGLSTQIVYLDENGLVAPLTLGGLSEQTRRPLGYLSLDYDGDGTVEIPVTAAFTGYEAAAWGGAEYLTRFMSYSPETGNLEPESSAYYNLSDGYIFTIPNRWLNLITVSRDPGTGELTFRKYDPALIITEMQPIVSFASAGSSAGEAYIAAGYELLTESDSTSFYVNIRAGGDEPLVLTMDEIRDNFHIIDESVFSRGTTTRVF